jgi:hypothetical protein
LYPDFFIFNCLNSERRKSIASAIVFSPLKFVDEETDYIIHALEKNNYFVKELINKNASAYHIDYHVKEFPYDILHLCSHGGQVDGYGVKHAFTDQLGVEHVIEFDEVVSFAPDKSEELTEVTSKYIWRFFDGLEWKSEEMKSKNYAHHVFVDMQKSISSGVPREERAPKKNIIDSCAIICEDFFYQATFNTIAGSHANPFVFNNTCWSWSEIADSFLNAGARGYIGTLWDVSNDAASETAKLFYSATFSKPIIDSLHVAASATRGTESENVYVYWGLHFTTLSPGQSVEKSRKEVMHLIFNSYMQWRDHLKTVKNLRTKEQIQRLIRWDLKQIKSHFISEWLSQGGSLEA